MSEKTINKVPNVPNLRFRNFNNTWIKKSFLDLVTVKARIGWQGLRQEEFMSEGDYYLITGTDFKNNKIDFKTCKYISKERYDQDVNIQIKNNDILITKDGSIGKVAIVENIDKPATLNAGVYVVRLSSNEIRLKYLFHYLKAPFLLDFADKSSTGGTIKHLNQNVLGEFKIPFSSFHEQNKIAIFLDLIDERISTQSKIISAIESQIFSINHLMISKNTETIKLGELCKFEPKTNRKSGDGLESGKYPFFTNEENQTQYLDTYDFDGEYIIANTGGKANFKYYKGKFAAMSDCLILKINSTDLTTFYSNVLRGKQDYINHVGFEGSGLKHLNKDWLLNMQVPTYNKSIRKYLLAIEMLKEKLQKEKDILSLYKKQKAYLLQNMFI